ncbi:hypothetical protein ONS95_001435 [Cadophora gregata]|uniref:uncharacterized protein n=1 Tax=Cadophora gregata TaxID=51156 RepID=UPI0026DCA0D4|nr:uncharacterized protein ONS95_001435 [Cadophora gregata]KAK0111055.1 hypothetical protein ONS95_001435 [Cadophora gregata]
MPGPERSLGCYRCRSMKLKCDQEHPECKRCQRVKVTCPGYRQENDLIFVDVSNQIRERGDAHRPRTSRKSTTESPKGTIDSPRKQRVTSSPSLSPPAFKILPQTDWNQHALCRFMSEFTMQTRDLKTNPGFLHNLPQLYCESRGRDPLLDHAVLAVSLAHHSNQSGSYDAALQARKSYGLSISLLNKELSEGNLQSESTLIAVLFLNYYQVFSDENPTSDVWSMHSDALSMLLRSRGTVSQFLDPRVGGITRAAVYIAVYRNLTRRILPGPEVALFEEALDSYKETTWGETTLALASTTRLLCKCDDLLAKKPSQGHSSLALLELITRFREEDCRYPKWYGSVAIDPDRLEDSFFDVIWVNSRRAARITLLQSLVELTLRVHPHSDLHHRLKEMNRVRHAAEDTIQMMADEISISTTSLLAEFEGKRAKACRDGEPIGCVAIAYFLSLAPLGIAIGVKTLSDEQRRYIAGQLAVVSSRIGLRRPLRQQWRK